MGLPGDKLDLNEPHQAVTLCGSDCYELFLFFLFDKQYSGKNSRAAPHGVWRNVFSLRAALIELVPELIGFESIGFVVMTNYFARGDLSERMVLQGSGARMPRPNYSPVVAILTG